MTLEGAKFRLLILLRGRYAGRAHRAGGHGSIHFDDQATIERTWGWALFPKWRPCGLCPQDYWLYAAGGPRGFLVDRHAATIKGIASWMAVDAAIREYEDMLKSQG